MLPFRRYARKGGKEERKTINFFICRSCLLSLPPPNEEEEAQGTRINLSFSHLTAGEWKSLLILANKLTLKCILLKHSSTVFNWLVLRRDKNLRERILIQVEEMKCNHNHSWVYLCISLKKFQYIFKNSSEVFSR